MSFTVKLQSPDYDNDTEGEEIALPVETGNRQLSSLMDMFTLPGGTNLNIDLAGLREMVKIAGTFTVGSADTAGFSNPIHMRDTLRHARTEWPENSIDNTDWGTSTLPSDEQDGSTDRAPGKARLIYDKEWDTGTSSYVNHFLYGNVADIQFQRVGSIFRDRVAWSVTFSTGRVVIG